MIVLASCLMKSSKALYSIFHFGHHVKRIDPLDLLKDLIYVLLEK